MSIPDAIVAWISALVQERVAAGLSVRFDKTIGWRISAPGSTAEIQVVARSADYQQLVRTLAPCAASWDPRPELLSAPLGLPLVAPGLTHLPRPLIIAQADATRLCFDMLGLALWALSRAEEAANTASRDIYGRFPVEASHACRLGYLDRPIVDEWFHILRQLARRTWPLMELATQAFRKDISHDIDHPSFIAGKPILSMLRVAAGDVLRRHNYGRGFTAPLRAALIRAGMEKADPFHTYDWLMDRAEKRNLRTRFFFICGQTDTRYDPCYDIRSPRLRRILKRIHARGHAIGIHPSYHAHASARTINEEALRLRKGCEAADIPLHELHSRTHYLRWSTPDTPRALAEAGVTTDHSLGYAGHIGFRAGTCIGFTAFDPVELRSLTLRVQPLVTMDVTLVSGCYMPADPIGSLQPVAEMVNRCRSVEGCFSLCWHNSELDARAKRALFEGILDL